MLRVPGGRAKGRNPPAGGPISTHGGLFGPFTRAGVASGRSAQDGWPGEVRIRPPNGLGGWKAPSA